MYSALISITLPYALAGIASKVGKALDPDLGGDGSFTRIVVGFSDDTPIYGDTISVTTPCTPEFKTQAEYMIANPESLFAAVSADYATRWGDLVPPTLAECQQFCAGIIASP